MSGLILRTLTLFAAIVCWSGVSYAQALPTLANTQSAATVKATPRTVQGDVWEFEIVFDTHSQELKDDLLKTVVLVPANGAQVAPAEWKGDPPSGHHRKGLLRFNAIKPRPDSVELRISRTGESKPRVFQWSLK